MTQRRDEVRPTGGNGHGEPVRGSRMPESGMGMRGRTEDMPMPRGAMMGMGGARSPVSQEGEMPMGGMESPRESRGMGVRGVPGEMPTGSMMGEERSFERGARPSVGMETPDVGTREPRIETRPGEMPAAVPGRGVSLGAGRGVALSGTWKVSFTLDTEP